MNLYLAIVCGMLATVFTGWLGIRIAKRANLIDMPGAAPHKKHSAPTPLAGGIILMLSLLILVPLFGLHQSRQFLGTLIGAVVIFIFGLSDDLKIMRPLPKLAGQIIALGVLILSGNYIRIFENPSFAISGTTWPYQAVDLALTALWVIGVTNAFNLIDSMDGLCVGVSGLGFGFFILGGLTSNQPDLALFSALLVGICLVILFLNTKPSHVFLGDSGAQTFGFLIASIAILYNPQAKQQLSSWFLPILLASVPIFDTTLVFFSRLRRGKPFYQSGCDHTYHRLVAMGMEPSHAVMAMVTTALFIDCVAFVALELPALPANLIFGAVLAAYATAFLVLDSARVTRHLLSPQS